MRSTKFSARTPTPVRAIVSILAACAVLAALALLAARWRQGRMRARLDLAVERMSRMAEHTPADARSRAAIAWGYDERLRLGLESPFRLLEQGSRDSRLTLDERRTVAWALLAHTLRGDTHHFDPASLDAIGPWAAGGRGASGEWHNEVIERAVVSAGDPRAAELGIRLAYTLASAEKIVGGIAPTLAAEAAALVADREIARREARDVVRSAGAVDPIDIVRYRRSHRKFYVERPVLLAAPPELEAQAIVVAERVLRSLRDWTGDGGTLTGNMPSSRSLASELLAVGRAMPPTGPLAVTVQRYLPMIRGQARSIDAEALARTQNAEMLVATLPEARDSLPRTERRALGRLMLAAAVSMRSLAQERVWFPGDSALTPNQAAATLGLASITFDRDVPRAWQPSYVLALADAIGDLRRILPAVRLEQLHVRFRLTSPADSALAMHDPRTRTLHLPVTTATGTLTHEIAHDLDRQSAALQHLAGYRSDIVARQKLGVAGASRSSRVAASLRALSDELNANAPLNIADRPAEVFATRVDWFVASALARKGISDGFLSAVQDELLTGHVVHPERLRNVGTSRTLLPAIDGMTPVAPTVSLSAEPSTQSLLRWALNTPIDRRGLGSAMRESRVWEPASLEDARSRCEPSTEKGQLLRLGAEARARGWLRLRAKWTPPATRTPWQHAALGESGWSRDELDARVAELRDHILGVLSESGTLASGIAAAASSSIRDASCA